MDRKDDVTSCPLEVFPSLSISSRYNSPLEHPNFLRLRAIAPGCDPT